jgi:hypothetical protein
MTSGSTVVNYTRPYLIWEVYQNDQFVNSLGYLDTYSRFVKVSQANYEIGDVFKVKVRYGWMGSPIRDYTVSVYSR